MDEFNDTIQDLLNRMKRNHDSGQDFERQAWDDHIAQADSEPSEMQDATASKLKRLLGVLVPPDVKENAERFNGYYGDFGNDAPENCEELLETMRDARFSWDNMLAAEELDEMVHCEAKDLIDNAIRELENFCTDNP